jgi:hypothetical protein
MSTTTVKNVREKDRDRGQPRDEAHYGHEIRSADVPDAVLACHKEEFNAWYDTEHCLNASFS